MDSALEGSSPPMAGSEAGSGAYMPQPNSIWAPETALEVPTTLQPHVASISAASSRASSSFNSSGAAAAATALAGASRYGWEAMNDGVRAWVRYYRQREEFEIANGSQPQLGTFISLHGYGSAHLRQAFVASHDQGSNTFFLRLLSGPRTLVVLPDGALFRSLTEKTLTAPQLQGDIPPAGEIIGRCIRITFSAKESYTALVIGHHRIGGLHSVHKIYHLREQCVEFICLRNMPWRVLEKGSEPWGEKALFGKRIYVYWPGEYSDEDMEAQDLAKIKFPTQPRIPFEAFVVLNPSTRGATENENARRSPYKLIYSEDSHVEVRDLFSAGPYTTASQTESDFKTWAILEEGEDMVDGLPLIYWLEGK